MLWRFGDVGGEQDLSELERQCDYCVPHIPQK